MTYYIVDHVFYNRILDEQEQRILGYINNEVTKTINASKIDTFDVTNFPENPDMDYDSDQETGFQNIHRHFEYVGKDRVIPKKRLKPYNKRFVVTMFGRTIEGKSVTIHVLGYTSRFYIKIPSNNIVDPEERKVFEQKFMYNIIIELKSNNRFKKYGNIFKLRQVARKQFFGFKNNEQDQFIECIFENTNARKCALQILGPTKRSHAGFEQKCIKIGNKVIPLEVFDKDVEPFMRFFHDRGLEVVGFMKLKNSEVKHEKLTNCDIELICKYEDVFNDEEVKVMMAPLKRLAFDIEAAPKRVGINSFPSAKQGDPIICIGADVIQTKNGDCMKDPIYHKRILFILNKCLEKHDGDFEVISFGNDEKAMILSFINFVRREMPDIIFSFNGNRFDWEYLFMRAEALGISRELCMMNKFINYPCQFTRTNLSSSALGNLSLKFPLIPGTINIDLYLFYNKMNLVDIPQLNLKTISSYFLDKYQNLKTSIYDFALFIKECIKNGKIIGNNNIDAKVAEAFLKNYNINDKTEFVELCKLIYEFLQKPIESDTTKDDLSSATLFKYYHDAKANSDSPESKKKMWLIAKYCIQDCTLLHKLCEKCSIVITGISVANTNRFPFKMIYVRGTGPLIYSTVTELTQKRGFVMPFVEGEDFDTYIMNDSDLREEWFMIKEDQKKAEAFKKKVMKSNSVAGAHVFAPSFSIQTNIAVFDFSSMYPNSMRAFNLSHDSIVLREEFEKYGNIPGVRYCDIKWQTSDNQDHWSRYVVDIPNRTHQESVLSEILSHYLTKRSLIKKKRDSFKKGTIEYLVYDAEQNAVKATTNSIYGQTIFRKSKLFMKAIGGCTTAIARCNIHLTSEIIKAEFPGSEIIYGDTDSVFIKFMTKSKDDKEEFYEVWDKAKKCAELVNEHFKKIGLPSISLVLEKVFSRLILFNSKKKYFGFIKTARNYNVATPVLMGITIKKRNATMLEKFVGRIVLDLFISDRSDQIMHFIEKVIEAMYRGNFEIDYYVKGSILKKESYTTKVPHDVARKIILMYDPNSNIGLHDRIEYIYRRRSYADLTPKKCDLVWPVACIQHLEPNERVIDNKSYIPGLLKIIEDILIAMGIDKYYLNKYGKRSKDWSKKLAKELYEKHENVFDPNSKYVKFKQKK